VKQIGKALWWAGPWIGLGAFIWRQQGLEARLSSWLEAANQMLVAATGRLTDVAAEAAGESEQGRVRDAAD
jgi:hypothetical protein